MTSVLDNHEVLCLENNLWHIRLAKFGNKNDRSRQQCKLPILFNQLISMMFHNIRLSIILVGFIDAFSFSDFALLLDF